MIHILLTFFASLSHAAVPSEATVDRIDQSSPLDHSEKLNLNELIGRIKTNSPRYETLKTQNDVAKAELKAARVLPNPTINLAILYLNSGFNQNGVSTYYANVTIPFLIAGQRHSRMKTAKAGLNLTEAEIKTGYQAIILEARQEFVALLAEQERLRLLDKSLSDMDRVRMLVEERKRSGYESAYDLRRVAVESATWKARRVEVDGEREQTAASLGILLGEPTYHPWAEDKFSPMNLKPNQEEMWKTAEEGSPVLQVARRQEDFTQRGIRQAKREAWPVPSITAGTVIINNYYSVSTTVGLTMPIPIFDFGQGNLARARAQNKLAVQQKQQIENETKGALIRSAKILDHRTHALHSYESEVLAQIPQLQEMAEDSFRSGQSSLIELLDATRARVEIQLEHIDHLEAVILAELDVLFLTGRIEQTE